MTIHANISVAPLTILTQGNALLGQNSVRVASGDVAIKREIAQLHATLADFRAQHGFGRAMAAPQAGIMKRVVVMNLGATPFALINPEITWRSEATFDVWDDCLSVPESVVRVRRHESISLIYEDERGRSRRWEKLPTDLSELVQHEIDHLDGVLMTERAVGSQAIRPIAEHATLIGAVRTTHRLSLAKIIRSKEVIDPVFLNSPQYNCEPLSEALGCVLTIKCDFVNPIRSFKGRGANFYVHEMRARGDTRPLVCASAGNWGQAMAYASRAAGRSITIFASKHANVMKVERMRALGATVLIAGEDFDAAKDAAKVYATKIDGVMIEDGLATEVSEGHGTMAIELLAHDDVFDAVVIALGNGAMLNGIARWFKAASPATRVYGVCGRGADSMEKSWRSKIIFETETANTIADGIAVRVPIPEAVSDMQGIVDDVLLVEDAHIAESMRLAHRHAGYQLEPAGAAGLAGIVAHRERFSGQRVATVLCGSNLTGMQVQTYFG